MAELEEARTSRGGMVRTVAHCRTLAQLASSVLLLLGVLIVAAQPSLAVPRAHQSCVRQHHWRAPHSLPAHRGHAVHVCAERGNAHPKHAKHYVPHHSGGGTAQLGGGYDNSRIAQIGLSLLNRFAGSCKEAVNNWVAAASNGSQHLGGGYYSDYQRAGGVQVGRDATIQGDIIQLNGPHADSFYEGMHTAVVVGHAPGSNVFDVVDSNWGWTNTVHHHPFDPYALASQHGLSVHFWRMGSAPASLPPAPPTPSPTPAGPPPGTYPHHVYHTCANGACGLRTHTAPSLSASIVSIKNDGDEVDIVCQTTGDNVYGKDNTSSPVWDKLSDGSYASDYYIDTSGTVGAFSPPIPRCEGSPTPSPPPQPPQPAPVVHYNCPNTSGAFGHYVPAGKHWGNDFVAQGSTITGGYLLIGANADGGNHSAAIGIFTGGPYTLSGELGSVTVNVSGYGGVNFTFPAPIHVIPGQSLWLVASGIGDFTGYDQNSGGADGCFIGSLTGTL
jgi:hypothetical protein